MREPRSNNRLFTARFSLRALLVAVAVAAGLLHFGRIGWRRYVVREETRQYSDLQATKKWPEASLQSFVIDEGRGVPDDFVVLVRSGNTFGCFVPRNQGKKGESAEYDWYYRTDGIGQFNSKDPNVKSGHSFTGMYQPSGESLKIKFGPFEIPWSGNETGWGFVYFDYNPDPPDRSGPDVLRICATNMKTLAYVDACDPRWVYKSHRQDVGLRGDENAMAAKAGQGK